MAPWSPPSSARQALPDLLLRRRLAMEQLRSGPFCIVPMPPRQVPADAAASPVVVAQAPEERSSSSTCACSHRARRRRHKSASPSPSSCRSCSFCRTPTELHRARRHRPRAPVPCLCPCACDEAPGAAMAVDAARRLQSEAPACPSLGVDRIDLPKPPSLAYPISAAPNDDDQRHPPCLHSCRAFVPSPSEGDD